MGGEAAKVFFDLAAGAPGGAGAHEGGGHFGEAGRAVGNERIPGAKIEFTVEFGNGVCFGENDFEAVGETRAGALGPCDRALGGECGNGCGKFRSGGSHYAASFLPASGGGLAFPGAGKTMARFSGTRYFFATR